MTVRAWFTISAVLLVALAGSSLFWFLRPAEPPALSASVPEARLEGSLVRSCWPQRGGELRCESREAPSPAGAPVIARSGDIRVVALLPVQPERGTTRIVEARTRRTVAATRSWQERVPYELEAGTWVLEAEARFPDGAYVRYAFPFRTR
ncbi:MAG TPA: hypothetical protein VM840_08865 [Actinomycetota bacterium]|nr:hypothetical protein [Actinomycetota bacterium]